MSPAKSAAVDRLLEVFRHQGFEGAAMSDIAEATGLGKSSLYHHFPGGKEEMAQAVFERAGEWLQRRIVAALDHGTRHERMSRMLKAVDEFYDGGAKPCLIAGMTVGASRERHGAFLKSAVETWVSALARALSDTGMAKTAAADAALDAVIRIEGSLIVSAALGDAAPFRKTLRRLRAELLEQDVR